MALDGCRSILALGYIPLQRGIFDVPIGSTDDAYRTLGFNIFLWCVKWENADPALKLALRAALPLEFMS